jgi:hypothetical protein
MSDQEETVNPRDLVRQFRESYLNVHEVKKRVPSAFAKAEIHSPRQKPIKESDLPQALRELLREHRQAHPGQKVAFLKYQRLVNGEPVLVIEDETGLPDEDQLLTLSQTITLTTSQDAHVVTDVVVARIDPV